MENLNRNKNNETNIGMNDLEVSQFYKFILRNQFILKPIIGGGVILSIFYTFLQKDIWQGEFQIVLENPGEQSGNPISIFASQFPKLDIARKEGKSQLLTEVEVLKSPSVLMSVFNFVNEEKLKKNNRYKKKSFASWKKNLNIGLQKGTSVLNLKYKDTDKSLILPVLRNITNKYQGYSGKKYKTEMKKSIDYLGKQVINYKSKSKDTLENAQSFSMKYDLPPLLVGALKFKADLNSNNQMNTLSGIDTKLDVETIRVNSANQIKVLDEKLNILSNLQEPLEIFYFSKTIPALKKEKTITLMEDIFIDLNNLKKFYNANSKRIVKLKNNQNSYATLLKQQISEYLNAQKTDISSRKKAFERPEGVIIKYQELWKEANINLMLLNDLESQYTLLKIENAKDKDPWDLITNPTLLDRKVGPSRIKILILWFLYSLSSGLLISYVIEQIKGIIYSSKELEKLIPYNLIDTLKADEIDNWIKNMEIISQGNLIQSDQKTIGILTLGENLEKFSQTIYSCLTKSFKNKKIIYIDDIIDINKTNSQILITSPGALKRDELYKFLRQIKLLKHSIVGWFLIE